MNSKKQDFSWIAEGIKEINEYNTLITEKGQELYNRSWLKQSMMPTSVAGWDELFDEIDEFLDDPNYPEEDKEKIKGHAEGAALLRNACKAIEEKQKKEG